MSYPQILDYPLDFREKIWRGLFTELEHSPLAVTPPDRLAFSFAKNQGIIAPDLPGVPDMSRRKLKTGSSSKGCVQHPAFSIVEDAPLNLNSSLGGAS